MGLPRIWGRVGANANALDELSEVPLSGDAGVLVVPPEVDERKRDDDDFVAKESDKGDASMGTGGVRSKSRDHDGFGVWWTVAYYVLLIGGAVGFWTSLYPLTESKLALGSL